MAPRNTRVGPDVETRGPARSFVQALDTFYAPARDTRSEQAFQRGVNAFSGIFEQKAAELKAQERDDEFQQGVMDAMREEAGQELLGVKTGKLFRQHSKYYMMGLNETRGKAAASKWKQDLTLAYEQWDGRHTDDDGSAFRAWMNEQVAGFMGQLGDDQFRVAGALPIINEVAANFAAQHTSFTATRLQEESWQAYDEIAAGIFDDVANGRYDTVGENGEYFRDWDGIINRLTAEADDMYITDGAEANDRLVAAAIRYANTHNDPQSIVALAKAHDSGKLKLSLENQERLANGMDAVEADIERNLSKRSSQEAAAAAARKRELQSAWLEVLQANPYADLTAWAAANGVEGEHFGTLATLQESFEKAAKVQNPEITATQRMGLEMELYNTSDANEAAAVLEDFIALNPNALSASDVAKYTREVLERTEPGGLLMDPVVKNFRDDFVTTIGQLASGNEFDMNKMPALATMAKRHYDLYLLAKSGTVDMNDPAAIYDLMEAAEQHALRLLDKQFPGALTEKSGMQPELGVATGAAQVGAEGDAQRLQQAAQEFADMVNVQVELPADPQVEQVNQYVEDIPLEEQPTPFEDPNIDAEYGATRETFYGTLIQRFTDGRDDRPSGEAAVQAASDVLANDPEFASELDGLAKDLGVPQGALIAVMDFETGGTFSTGVRNAAGSGATGLIQFMPATARALGTTTDALARMSRGEQMKYVRKYFQQFPSIRGGNVDDVYMAVLWPKAIGKPDDYVIFRRGTKAYQQNAGLDINKDGTVTKFEAARKVTQKFYGY